MFVLTRIRLSLRGEDGGPIRSVVCGFAGDVSRISHTILPEINRGTQVSVVNSSFKEGSAASLSLFPSV